MSFLIRLTRVGCLRFISHSFRCREFLESANEVIQTQNTSNRNEWWDESCKLIMSQKNEAGKKYLQDLELVVKYMK